MARSPPRMEGEAGTSASYLSHPMAGCEIGGGVYEAVEGLTCFPISLISSMISMAVDPLKGKRPQHHK